MQKIEIEMRVNGQVHHLRITPELTLLKLLRDELGLTSVKEGCGRGECGACTVVLDGKAVPSCLVLSVQARGKSVVTVEGLTPHNTTSTPENPYSHIASEQGEESLYCSNEEHKSEISPTRLHPLQEAFIANGAVQCGYCTPGMIMSAKALLDENPHPDRAAIKEAISGNLCRCTGYYQIVTAIENAAKCLEKDSPRAILGSESCTGEGGEK